MEDTGLMKEELEMQRAKDRDQWSVHVVYMHEPIDSLIPLWWITYTNIGGLYSTGTSRIHLIWWIVSTTVFTGSSANAKFDVSGY